MLTLCLTAWIGQAPPAPAPPAKTAARVTNADALRRQLGVGDEHLGAAGSGRVTIAVLDYGFDGFPERPYLPASTVVVEDYPAEFLARHPDLGDPNFKKPFAPGNAHGRQMAQIAWAMTGNDPVGPKFLLLNANGPTLFRRAVRFAIERKADIVLFSNVFEGAGDGDGRGPINAIVGEALRAGVIWINAAGNNGGHVFDAPVHVGLDGVLRLHDGNDGTALRIRNRLDENTLTFTLTWSGYQDAEDAGTDKDLDFWVEGPTGVRLGSAELRQVTGPAGAGESRNPRERLVLHDLPADLERDYCLYVRYKGGTFAPTDRLRVLVTATRDGPIEDPVTRVKTEAIELRESSRTGEMFPPADHPRVLAVGDLSPTTSVGPTADRRLKPDALMTDATVYFSNGEQTSGSSNAAAALAGVVALLKGNEPKLTTETLLRWSNRALASAEPPGREISWSEARQLYSPLLLDRIERSAGRQGLRAWASPMGHLVVGTPAGPAAYPSLFPRFGLDSARAAADRHEAYLAVRPDLSSGPRAAIIDSYRLRDSGEPYPWQGDPRSGGLPVPARWFVEVRAVPSYGGGSAGYVPTTNPTLRERLQFRLWKCPTPSQLFALPRGAEPPVARR